MKCENVERILLSREDLDRITKNLGEQITKDYQGKKLLMVGILKGCFMFMADLMRAISQPAEIDFMVVSSYGSGVKSSGVVKTVYGYMIVHRNDKTGYSVSDELFASEKSDYQRAALEQLLRTEMATQSVNLTEVGAAVDVFSS